MEVSNRQIATDTISSKLVYFVKGDGGSGVALQGDRGPSGTTGMKGDSGYKGPVGSQGPTGKRPLGNIGKIGPVGSKGEIGARDEKGDKGDTGGVGQQGSLGPRGSTGPRGVQGAKGLRGVAGIQVPLGVQRPVGTTGIQGERGPEGHYGTQGLVGDKGDRGERGERGSKGEKGIQGDNSDVLSVLADHQPIQLVTRYGGKICIVKYHVSEDRSSIVESSGGVETLRNVGPYHEPSWYFDGNFVNGQGHVRANVQKTTGHGHFLELKNSAHHSPYDLVDNKVNAIYIVYKIRKYDSTGTEHNYLFSCGMDDNHRGICFLKDEKAMRVYGVAGKPNYMDISNFPTRFYNPCRKDKWNVFCVVCGTTSGKSSLWVYHGKIRDFAFRLPLKASTLNLFKKVVHFDDARGFDGYIESAEMYNYCKSIPSGLIAARMTYLCEKYKIPKRADGCTII